MGLLTKSILLWLFLCLPCIQSAIVLDRNTVNKAWYLYKAHYSVNFHQSELTKRYEAFKESLRHVIIRNIAHELTGDEYRAGLNCASTLTRKERNCVTSKAKRWEYNEKNMNSMSRIPKGLNDTVGMYAFKAVRFGTETRITKDTISFKKTKDIIEIETGAESTNTTITDSEKVNNDGAGISCFCFPKRKCPDSIDWVKENRVYKAGCQACGDCYAWAATYALGAALAIRKKQPAIDLSVQEAKDCSYNITQILIEPFNEGCDGGDPYFVYSGLKKNTKYSMTLTDEYVPYNDHYGTLTCDVAKATKKSYVKLTKHQEVQFIADCDLEKQLQKGPVATDMCISNDVSYWNPNDITKLYSNLNCLEECMTEMKKANETVETTNHNVLIVGYTPDAWIIQNSYGTTWGTNGIGHFTKAKRGGKRICNLAENVAWPEV